MPNVSALKVRRVSTVETIAVVRGSATSVGKVTEQCRGHIPREENSKSAAVTLMP